MALKPRDPRHRDPHYGTGYDCECEDCGRLFDSKDDFCCDPVKPGDPCPDDECPSHNLEGTDR